MTAERRVILFDLSRLISRAGRQTPTGIDRVELAYAEHLIGGTRPLHLTMLSAAGHSGLLPKAAAVDYIRAIGRAWRGYDPQQIRRTKRLARRLHVSALLHGEYALQQHLRNNADDAVYLLVSHHHLEKHRVIARLKQRSGARFICLIHDLIPIEFPEYALPGQDDKHRRRIDTAAALADGIIVNSSVTRNAFQPYLAHAGRAPPVVAAPFGVDLPLMPRDAASPIKPPYFVCVGTIEARKNHLMLLKLWRRLAAELGDAAPRLVLIGQRGWETENVIDMLERCPALRGVVFEYGDLPDPAAMRLVKGAQALLLPSFAEGFGFPLVEALALGTPVLCSDLPALHETGGSVAEFLDPLDGPGWRAAIVDYSQPSSPRREAQLSRLRGWRAPSWQDHFAAVDALVAQTSAVRERPIDIAAEALAVTEALPTADRS